MNPTIQRVNVTQRMSGATVAGNVAYVSGQVPTANGLSIEQQTQDVLAKVDALLLAVGSTREHLLSASVWLTSSAHFQAFNAVWDAWVPAGHAPARACVQSGLMRAGIDVEVAVTAWVPTEPAQ